MTCYDPQKLFDCYDPLMLTRVKSRAQARMWFATARRHLRPDAYVSLVNGVVEGWTDAKGRRHRYPLTVISVADEVIATRDRNLGW